jgi:UDP-N-acetylglucosamine diphosphorylase / glucose-1-phosphate thymidylyltransferase / UDP-N-acetylgalactosamine diphosphorylase / glucosamine-1-phosphate N-acetyltransferase / galactosamine-1-phosphate N-acetyltransferase
MTAKAAMTAKADLAEIGVAAAAGVSGGWPRRAQGIIRRVQIPQLFAALPAPFLPYFDPQAPWALLGAALDQVLDGLASSAIEVRLLPEVHLAGDRIAIGRGTRIHPGVVLEGPLYIGRDVEIRPGAYVRGGAWIGDGCVVGASTEIKRGILLPGARAPHLNYVGDSILGADVNLGAGTILSNFRHDGREVRIGAAGGSIGSGRRKLGAVLGDGVLTGCNCVLHPGAVVGRGTQIYPGVQLRSGIYPASSIVKLRQQLEVVPLADPPAEPKS